MNDRRGVHISDRRGEPSYLCADGRHERCTGVIAGPHYVGTRRYPDEVSLHVCGCWRCDCSRRADLVAVAATVRARSLANDLAFTRRQESA